MTNSSTSSNSSTSRHTLSVLAVPAFSDNYLWLIHDGVNAAVVDPGDAAPILAALQAHQLTLCAILLTHHHADHTGGVPELLQHFTVPVFGPRKEAIANVSVTVGQGDTVSVPQLGLTLSVLDVPGHTLGHVAYVRDDAVEPWLFCGDTLFGAGCGRLFEGTPAQMVESLGKLSGLPDASRVYCAHEYTLSNLRFASAVEPGNAELQVRVAADTAKREQGVPTVPSTIGLEKATNPFLRHQAPEIVTSLRAAGKLARGASPVEAFAALRLWKNTF
ncbi:hydroxyacylglutathione hydrolase [Janthinobacterium agaricidamnosum]|uniref:Hydroxyacylglutathione hydrolase n=1 Tax=Janthinobacterium agaricidamnosum NBRC 102515 = DSM 9628 TaxID=1349767 RepID=W0V4V4_9BURK|nr:hydroxyacylglutathione hydrolase [Janthinobacterium agaricidamnosum]CDG82901.1 hydroxyacylglutathione hydrolase [Janthinobacterium agaricidamnosum NBRC 102515 = DSM 9628]